METTFEEVDQLGEINQRLGKCVDSWKLEYETRDISKPDFSYQVNLRDLVSEGIDKGYQVRVSIAKTDENSHDLSTFGYKKELPNGEFEIVAKAIEGEQTNPNRERPTVLVPLARSGISLVDGVRGVVVVYPNEVNSISVLEAKKELGV